MFESVSVIVVAMSAAVSSSESNSESGLDNICSGLAEISDE